MRYLKKKLSLLFFSIGSFLILTGFTNASENTAANTTANITANAAASTTVNAAANTAASTTANAAVNTTASTTANAAVNTTANVTEDQPVINFLGDSITFGAGTTSSENTYASILGRIFHAKVNNYGISGTTLACNSAAPFTFRYTAMDQNADMIVVFGGTNDFCMDVPMGAVGDTSFTTFYGGLNILMTGLKNRYPGASIVFLTPIKRTYYIAWNDKNHVNATLEDYRNAIITMGQLYGIRVIDLYPAEELDFTKSPQYMPDGLHPSDAGQQKIAEYIVKNL